MKNFLLYIVFILGLFNATFVGASEVQSKVDELLNSLIPNHDNNYEVRSFVKEEPEAPKKLITSNNDFFLLFAMPNIIDKLYQGDNIHRDITPFLSLVYPNLSTNSLIMLGDVLKYSVRFKRIYKEVVAGLKYRIKAKSILPKDADIIAKKGEFAEEEEDYNAKFNKNEYIVNYQPYKYIEYDYGELGEPVRLRDKNYYKLPDTDELNLALLSFDVKGIFNALKKIPKYTDYSAEKFVELDNGLKARIIFDHVDPGRLDKINGVIDVHIPDGFYINGDFLNKKVRPRFVLSENNEVNLNVSDFNLYYPLALGVSKGNRNKRVLLNVVRFPFDVKRSDVKKSLYLNGSFYFNLCNTKDECFDVATKHSIRLKPSLDERISVFNNYVTQSHTHLPNNASKNVNIKNVYINRNNKTAVIYFNTKDQLSNISAMIEDEYGTNFVNSKYMILSPDLAVAQFDVQTDDEKVLESENYQIAVSGSFNSSEVLRDVVTPIFDDVQQSNITKLSHSGINWFLAFIFGVLICFTPGIFFVITNLINILKKRDDYYISLFRFLIFSCLGLIGYLMVISHYGWYKLYLNPFVVTFGLFVICSQIYFIRTNFNIMLFRPFSSIFKIGMIDGLVCGLLMMSFPLYFSDNILSVFSFNLGADKIYLALVILLGFISPILIMGIFFRNSNVANINLYNLYYNIFYIVISVVIMSCAYTGIAFLIMAIGIAIVIKYWSIYPALVLKEDSKTKSKNKKKEFFYAIQNKSLALFFVIYIVVSSGIYLTPTKKVYNISHTEILNVINEKINDDKMVLVSVDNLFSWRKLYNFLPLNKLSKGAISKFNIIYNENDKEANYWLNKFDKAYLPLYVIYTKRHPNGLLLPTNLINIDWNTVAKYFEIKPF